MLEYGEKVGLYDSREEHDACGIGFMPTWITKEHTILLINHWRCCVD